MKYLSHQNNLFLFFVFDYFMILMLKRDQIIILLDAVISIGLIVFILSYVGINEVIDHLLKVDLFLLFLSIIFLLAMYIGMSARIKILLHDLGIKLGWPAILRSHFVGMLLADFTPARSGYFATAASLHYNYKVPSEKALISIFGPQIFDFVLKVTAGMAGVLLLLSKFLKEGEGAILYIAGAGMSILVITMILLLFSQRFLALFNFTMRLPLVGGLATKVISIFERMQESSHVVIKRTPHLIVLLIFTWSMKAISWYFVAKSLGITISGIDFHEVFFYFFFQPLITMLEFMPSPTIAGVGLSEGGSALVMALFGVTPAAATSFAILARGKTILINLVAIPDTIKIIPKFFDSKVKTHL